MSASALIARMEAGELLLRTRGLGWLLAVAGILSAFSLLLVSDSELSLLDNAQVVYAMSAIATALGALLAVVVGTDSTAGERERGSLVSLLLTPASRNSIMFGKFGGQAIIWSIVYAITLPYLWAVGSTGQNLADGAICLALLGTPVVFAFGFLSMGLGTRIASVRSCLLLGLIALLLAASPVLLGPSLRQTAIGRAFDAVNPFSAAVNAYDAVIIDSQSLFAQLPHLAIVLAWLAASLWFAMRGFRQVYRKELR